MPDTIESFLEVGEIMKEFLLYVPIAFPLTVLR